MKKRIIGIDLARALAIFGMIIVNFKMVIGQTGTGWLPSFIGIFDGKAAATFVVLAGIGIALMTNSAIQSGSSKKIKTKQWNIFKRALFLFIVGLSYITIWPADILHFYGIYMLLTLTLIRFSAKWVLLTAGMLIFSYPLLMMIFEYDTGWNFDTFDYLDFWSTKGFFRNLFYNGFHPVIPWSAFMLVGLWFGKQDLYSERFLKKSLWISLGIFIFAQLLSFLLITLLSAPDFPNEDLKIIFGTSPMPPLPIYMITGSSIAVFIITGCILLAKRFEQSKIIQTLTKTGQLALTFYVAHVIIGMGAIEFFYPDQLGTLSLLFSFTYALIFSLCCVGFALLWFRYKKSGPLEYLMRKITD